MWPLPPALRRFVGLSIEAFKNKGVGIQDEQLFNDNVHLIVE